jgi:hypothetical protein
MEQPHLQLGNRHVHINAMYIDTKRRRNKNLETKHKTKQHDTAIKHGNNSFQFNSCLLRC